jgi:hypothetical protein
MAIPMRLENWFHDLDDIYLSRLNLALSLFGHGLEGQHGGSVA